MIGPGQEGDETLAGDSRQQPVIPQEKQTVNQGTDVKFLIYVCFVLESGFLHSIAIRDTFSLFSVLHRKALTFVTSITGLCGHQLFILAQNSSDPKLCAEKKERRYSLL